ncbi:hypothetical protein SRABI27_00196 [Pedobacter sp. Bi27]|uniref:hypothetical protein n=1 Tax=Pedobacter sp. Bi27 TaxID=2822351 RepID=UPI001D663FC6|nr:hypothetical protein [Pedobacter sp. Bi27]CAH0137650.1 hypothetical protein SRABI27_00196 [Pedobacter sp. Bi27]
MSIFFSKDENYELIFEIAPADKNQVADFDLLKADLEAIKNEKEKLSIQHNATLIYCSYNRVDNYSIYFINPLLRSLEDINWVDDIPVSGGITTFKSNKFDKPIKIDVKFTFIGGDVRSEFEISDVSLMRFKD